MADKSPLAYLPETSKEAIEANRNYQEALQRLNASLDQRKNRFFDPRYMAAAQAFLSPTKTGSFFEALGTAAGAVGQAQEGLLREEQDIAKLNLDVAGQQLGMERQKQLMAPYLQTGQRAAAPGGGVPTTGQAPSAGALPGATASQRGAIDIGVSEEDFMAEGAMRNIPYSQRRAEWVELQSKAADLAGKGFKTTEGGAYRLNPATGEWEFTAAPSGKTTSMRIFGPGQGKVFDNVPEALGARLNALDPSSPDYMRIANTILYGNPLGPTQPTQDVAPAPAATTTRVEGAPPAGLPKAPDGARSRIESVEEKERRKAEEEVQRNIEKTRAEATAKEVGQSEGVRRNAIFDGAASAEDSERQATMLKQFAEDPSASKMFGLLSKPGVWPAIGRLVETGVGANQFRIGIPELQTALTTAGLNEREIAQYQTALQAMVNFQLRMSQYVKGAVSNYEQGLFQRASINQNDRPETIRMKSNLAILLADFARRKAELFEDANVSTTKFIRSPQYQQLLRDTDDKMEAIISGKGVRRREKSQTQGGNTADRLREELGR